MRLIINSLKTFQKKWIQILSIYAIIIVLNTVIDLSLSMIRSNTLILTLIQTLFNALLFTGIYRITYENRKVIDSLKFDATLFFVFMGFINLNFMVYLIQYFTQSSANGLYAQLAKVLILIASFVFCFYPALALKGNTSLFTAGKKSIDMIQDGSNDLVGLFVLYGISLYALNTIPYELTVVPILKIFIIFGFNGISPFAILTLIKFLVAGLITILITIMVQKYSEYL